MKRDKNVFVMFLILAAGIVLGGFIGEIIGSFPFMSWLRYGNTFGLTQPITLELSVIQIVFGFSVRLTMASLIGLCLAVIGYRKL